MPVKRSSYGFRVIQACVIGTSYSSSVRMLLQCVQICVGGAQDDRIAIKNVLASVRPIAFRFRYSSLTSRFHRARELLYIPSCDLHLIVIWPGAIRLQLLTDLIPSSLLRHLFEATVLGQYHNVCPSTVYSYRLAG